VETHGTAVALHRDRPLTAEGDAISGRPPLLDHLVPSRRLFSRPVPKDWRFVYWKARVCSEFVSEFIFKWYNSGRLKIRVWWTIFSLVNLVTIRIMVFVKLRQQILEFCVHFEN